MAATINFLVSNRISPNELVALRVASKTHVKETHTPLKARNSAKNTGLKSCSTKLPEESYRSLQGRRYSHLLKMSKLSEQPSISRSMLRMKTIPKPVAHDKELANIEANMNVILDLDKPEITKDKSSS